jgi:hypothetical protein
VSRIAFAERPDSHSGLVLVNELQGTAIVRRPRASGNAADVNGKALPKAQGSTLVRA